MTEPNLLAELQVPDEIAMHEFGMRVAAQLRAGDLVVLVGPLGAGKTTFTRGVGEALGAIGNVSSPTFVIARTHKLENRTDVLVHADAYRLGSAAELDDLDIDFANSIVLVEWGKGLLEGVAENWLEIEIERDQIGESDVREVRVTCYGQRWESVRF
ncbi:MAG: tRNA (adenosine(37)-N6)-threonylcarbamoyltransferase complex ATPase subunit type 1 TsaE [Micrococcales bacterium]